MASLYTCSKCVPYYRVLNSRCVPFAMVALSPVTSAHLEKLELLRFRGQRGRLVIDPLQHLQQAAVACGRRRRRRRMPLASLLQCRDCGRLAFAVYARNQLVGWTRERDRRVMSYSCTDHLVRSRMRNSNWCSSSWRRISLSWVFEECNIIEDWHEKYVCVAFGLSLITFTTVTNLYRVFDESGTCLFIPMNTWTILRQTISI